MSISNEINNKYFDWMTDLVCNNLFSKELSYHKLLIYLHLKEFTYSIAMDKNRAIDGIDLRYRFAYDHPYIDDAEIYLKGPCSILEMLIALAMRCEETIMDDPQKGNRMQQWFWGMISNLGLSPMTDDRFDKKYVNYILERFLNREYDPNGKGGLFTVRNCDRDLRTVEIWNQLNWYLNTIA